MTPRRIAYLVLGLNMALFAWLQVNDPDPLLWVPLYAAASALFVAAVFGWSRRWSIVVVWVAYGIVGALVLPGFIDWLFNHPWGDLTGVMSTERQYIEDSREFLGLVIAAACLLFLWFRPPGALSSGPSEN